MVFFFFKILRKLSPVDGGFAAAVQDQSAVHGSQGNMVSIPGTGQEPLMQLGIISVSCQNKNGSSMDTLGAADMLKIPSYYTTGIFTF